MVNKKSKIKFSLYLYSVNHVVTEVDVRSLLGVKELLCRLNVTPNNKNSNVC